MRPEPEQESPAFRHGEDVNFGPSLAIGLGAGFIPARKPDKLPPGTALALAQLVQASGAAVVGAAFLSQVAGLGGREALGAIPAAVLVELGGTGEEEAISK